MIALLCSAAAMFDIEKISKSRCSLKDDSHANIYFMEGYLHKEELEYPQNSHAYRDIGSHEIFNVNIDDNSHVDNAFLNQN